MAPAPANSSPSIVGLGNKHYRVDRNWLAYPDGKPGFVSQLAVNSCGNLFLVNRGDPVVQIFSPAGNLIGEWANKPLTHGHGIYIANDDRVFIIDSDNHCLFVFDQEGRHIQTIGEPRVPSFGMPFNHPTDVAVAPNGDIYISDGYGNSNVHRFSAKGELIQTWGCPGDGPGQFTNPHAIWIDKLSRVLVADRENHRVQIFNLEGEYLTEIRGLYLPTDICEDQNGIIYVSDQTPRLSAYSPSGQLVGRCKTFGAIGHGIAADKSGNIYIADMMPSHVTRFVPK